MTAAKDNSAAKGRDEKAAAEDAMKEKYAEFRLAAAQIKQVQEQLQAVEEKKQELEEAAESVSKLNETGKGTKLLVPVTSGIFASATMDKSDELVVSVGNNVCVKKTAEEAENMLKAKLLELTGYEEGIIEELNKLTDQANEIEKVLGLMLQEGEERQ